MLACPVGVGEQTFPAWIFYMFYMLMCGLILRATWRPFFFDAQSTTAKDPSIPKAAPTNTSIQVKQELNSVDTNTTNNSMFKKQLITIAPCTAAAVSSPPHSKEDRKSEATAKAPSSVSTDRKSTASTASTESTATTRDSEAQRS